MSAALDIALVAQDAIHAGTAAGVTFYLRNSNPVSNILTALFRAGVIFQSTVWCCSEGCLHPATACVMDSAVRMVRTTRGEEVAAELRVAKSPSPSDNGRLQ